MPNEKWTSAGGVVLDSLEEPYRVYVCKPSNNYGPWTFPKGRVDAGEGLEETALREVQEEAGVPAKMLPNGSLGTGVGSYSITHYFMMVRTGQIGAHDYEMEEVRCCTLEEAKELFESDGNSRDVGILSRAAAYIEKNVKGKEKMSESKVINELKTNLLGKIFFATVGAWLVGKAVNVKLRGTNEQVQTVANALLASKKFQDELKHPGATVESVMNKLSVKHMTAQEFEKQFNIPFPLLFLCYFLSLLAKNMTDNEIRNLLVG